MLDSLQAVAEELVDQVADRCRVVASLFSWTPVMLLRRGGCPSRQTPDPAGGGETIVLDPALGDRYRPSRGSRDRRGSRISLQRFSIGEPRPVITDFGQNTRAGGIGEARKLVMIV